MINMTQEIFTALPSTPNWKRYEKPDSCHRRVKKGKGFTYEGG